MRIAIIQSCYVPWRGFFDLIGRCDEYVIFDQTQYAKRHWHNRNCINTATGVEWLTIPVLSKGRYEQSIDQVEIEKPWAEKHWRALELAYRRAPIFRDTGTDCARLVRASRQGEAADGRQRALSCAKSQVFCGSTLGSSATPPIPPKGTKTERLLGIARAAGADRYLSGPSAKAYFDEAMFAAAGISVEWMSYEGYPDIPNSMAPSNPPSPCSISSSTSARMHRATMRADRLTGPTGRVAATSPIALWTFARLGHPIRTSFGCRPTRQNTDLKKDYSRVVNECPRSDSGIDKKNP